MPAQEGDVEDLRTRLEDYVRTRGTCGLRIEGNVIRVYCPQGHPLNTFQSGDLVSPVALLPDCAAVRGTIAIAAME